MFWCYIKGKMKTRPEISELEYTDGSVCDKILKSDPEKSCDFRIFFLQSSPRRSEVKYQTWRRET